MIMSSVAIDRNMLVFRGIGLQPEIFVKNKLPDVLAGKETLETAFIGIMNLSKWDLTLSGLVIFHIF